MTILIVRLGHPMIILAVRFASVSEKADLSADWWGWAG